MTTGLSGALCLHVPGTSPPELSILEHRPVAIDAWARSLRERFGGAPMAIAVELSRGPIVSALLEHHFFVIFPIQPTMLAQYRRAFKSSGAKDDPTDAEFALELVLPHRDKLAPLRRQSAAMRTLQRLVEERRRLVQDRVRITNRITHALKSFFPQVVDWFRDNETAVFADLVERWPTLQDAQRARDATLLDFFHTHSVRYKSAVERRIAAIRAERPLTTDEAVIEPAKLWVQVLLPQLRASSHAIERFEAQIEQTCAKLADYRLFSDLLRAGKVYAARLLAAFGEQRERFLSAAALQRCAGIAPVLERSGGPDKGWVHWRTRCPKFLRQTFIEWAAQSIAGSFWAHSFHEMRRAKGATRNAALRALAFRWIRVLHRCWVNGLPYDESRYLSSLQKRHFPILHFTAQVS